jgi:excisionase family DNA binding protein
MGDESYLTVAEVVERFRVSKMSIYRLIEAGELSAVRLGTQWRITEEALVQYVEKATSS